MKTYFKTDTIRAGFENSLDLYISVNGEKKVFWQGQEWFINIVEGWIKWNLADDWGDEWELTGFQDVKNQLEITIKITSSDRYLNQEFTFIEDYESRN